MKGAKGRSPRRRFKMVFFIASFVCYMGELDWISQEGLSPCTCESTEDNPRRAPVPCCPSMGRGGFPKGSIARIRQRRVFSLFSRTAARAPHLPVRSTCPSLAEQSPGYTGWAVSPQTHASIGSAEVAVNSGAGTSAL